MIFYEELESPVPIAVLDKDEDKSFVICRTGQKVVRLKFENKLVRDKWRKALNINTFLDKCVNVGS